MHGAHDYLVGLAQLHQVVNPDERRTAWRQAVAALATVVETGQPTPLEGLAPQDLLASARAALDGGLVDDLAWLSRAEAATALLELAAALPAGREKRTLGRRVLEALHQGDAFTFATIARSLALSAPKALAGPGLRARVALSLRLPLALSRSSDGLALALICRPALEGEWLATPSTGSLPARRLAARILERAAREVVRRTEEGDDSGLRVFARPSVRAAWDRLLADRESLVWRPVAVARGLLAAIDPARAEEVKRALTPQRGPTEWRRAAASLGAGLGSDPEGVGARCRDLARSEICRRHPAVTGALLRGVALAGEVEPQAAEALLTYLVQAGTLDVIEALAEVRREHLGGELGAAAARDAVATLRAVATPADDGVSALRDALLEDLEAPRGAPAGSLGHHLIAATLAFAEGKDLRPATEAAIEAAGQALNQLQGLGDDTAEHRRRAGRLLRELDLGLLETTALAELSTLSNAETSAETMGKLLTPLGQWLLEREGQPVATLPLLHPVAQQRRLRALLHHIDGDSGAPEPGPRPRELALRAFRVLLARTETERALPLRRTLCASLARASDALVRQELCELSDLLVAALTHVRAAADLDVLAEASMIGEVRELFSAAAELARASSGTPGEHTLTEAYATLARALPPGISPRVEGLRRFLLETAAVLEELGTAPSTSALAGSESPLATLEPALRRGAQLCASACQRLGLAGPTSPFTASERLHELRAALERGAIDVAATSQALRADLPGGLAQVFARALEDVAALPAEPPLESLGRAAPPRTTRLPLPLWLPASRIVGGFYIVRPIGNGAGGSVFVARRAEERNDEGAESYALKVPSYSGQNAHTLDEDEFLQLFREEAGALLTLPPHENLAGFVTFDARARPKPLLVMELVPGPTLERILDKRELTVPLAFDILAGLAAGLAVMHETGLGHFDLKPGNVILRQRQSGPTSHLVMMEAGGPAPAPVLVDFGLAGRRLRPGCASPIYGAPEVWDSDLYRLLVDPTAADVYAFCCLAHEVLTGRTLFEGDSLPALIAGHLAHQGRPPALARLQSDLRLAQLAEILAAGLPPDPRERPSISALGNALADLAPRLADRSWPL